MNVQIQQVDLSNLSQSQRSDINQVLKKSDGASIFHTIEWNQLLIQWFGLELITLLAMADQQPVGLYIFQEKNDRVCWSSAIDLQSVYGGPIAINDDPVVIVELLKASEKICPASYFNIWTSPNVRPTPFKMQDYEVEEMLTGVIRLDRSEDEAWKNIHRKKRAQIRKALERGAEVEERDAESLKLYRDMVTETLSGTGIDPLPLGFYKLLMERLKSLGLSKLFYVVYDHDVISGTIILYYKDTVYGWDMGWRREFSDLSPNDLLVWNISKRARLDGYKFFDLLRVEPDRLPGIAKWKMHFGLEIIPVYGFYKETMGFRLYRAGNMLINNPTRALQKLKSHLAFNQS